MRKQNSTPIVKSTVKTAGLQKEAEDNSDDLKYPKVSMTEANQNNIDSFAGQNDIVHQK